jgi:copper chaperone
MLRCDFDTPRPYATEALMSGNQTTRQYIVEGMTCEHCVLSVTEEVSDVAGVEAVDVELASGRLTVSGNPSEAAVREAVAAAGYAVNG